MATMRCHHDMKPSARTGSYVIDSFDFSSSVSEARKHLSYHPSVLMPVVYIWIADMGMRHRFIPMPVSMFCIDIHWTDMVLHAGTATSGRVQDAHCQSKPALALVRQCVVCVPRVEFSPADRDALWTGSPFSNGAHQAFHWRVAEADRLTHALR